MKAAFSSIFGKKKPLKEILRENKRTITRAVRDIDREKTNLEKQEKKLIGEIKKNAKAGQMGAVKVRDRLPETKCSSSKLAFRTIIAARDVFEFCISPECQKSCSRKPLLVLFKEPLVVPLYQRSTYSTPGRIAT